jgi:sortase A
LKKTTLLLLVAGFIFITIGSIQYTNSRITKQKGLIEANRKINEANEQLGASSTEQPEIGAVVGILALPKLSEELPIIEGTDPEDLAKGVGHFQGSSFPRENGQIVLSGHRDTVFRRLGELELGDLLTMKLSNGNFSYKIEQTKIVDADDRSIITLQKEKEVLIVTTCYPFSFIGDAPQRYIITATPLHHTEH